MTTTIWTIHKAPTTYTTAPYAAVEWMLDVSEDHPATAVPLCIDAQDLAEARACVPAGRVRSEPLPTDEPDQVEAWL